MNRPTICFCLLASEAGSCSLTSGTKLWGRQRSESEELRDNRTAAETCCSSFQRPHGVKVKHGRLQLGQLYRRDPHSPDVAELVVAAVLFHCCYFRSHPVQRKRAETTHGRLVTKSPQHPTPNNSWKSAVLAHSPIRRPDKRLSFRNSSCYFGRDSKVGWNEK